jgi:hypothetical protein
MSDAELTHELRKDIDQYIISLKSPKLAFHWVDASDVNPPKQYNVPYPATAPHFKSYVDKAGSAIYNKLSEKAYDIAGPGLYMSSHPSYSRSYGGKKTFGLIVGLVKPGAKIFVNFGYGGEKINSKLLKEIESRDCGVISYSDLLDSSDLACTKVKQLLVGKDIAFADARLYGWTGREISPGCRSINLIRDMQMRNTKTSKSDLENLDTLVVYSSRLFSSVYGYTHLSTLDGDLLSNQILSYLKGQQLEGLSPERILSESQLADNRIKPMSRGDVEKFSQKYIFGCEK